MARLTYGKPTSPLQLRRASGGRYLCTPGGRPFLLFGNAAWELTQNLSDEEVETFLDDQQARGVNCLFVDPIGKHWSINSPNNLDDVAPFTGTTGGQEDLSTPNETFWAHVDWVFAQCAERGIVVAISMPYLGYVDVEGWHAEVLANSEAKCEALGTFLGARYASFPNILWVMGGDRLWSGTDATVKTNLEALTDALKVEDTVHLASLHLAGDDPAVTQAGPWQDWTFVYRQPHTISGELRDAYDLSPTRPTILGEAWYVDTAQGSPSRQELRGQYWHAMTSGAMGFIFGDENVWPFGGPNGYAGTDWEGALNSVEMQDAQRIFTFFSALAWWLLEPEPTSGSSLITGGRGSPGTSFVTGTLASDGSFAVIYIPAGGEITVDCDELAGAVTATWYDPTNGSTSSAGSGLTGSQDFDPSTNAAGGTDMVLLLEAA